MSAETSAVPGQGISINSQRNFSNSFVVDGLSANDDAAGLVGSFYGLDVVNELQVITSGGQAEFGRALGGYANVVTKTGTDSVHGDAYGFFRNQRLDAANALTNTDLPLTQAQYGASLGGPIVRDRSFYFTNFERRDLNQEGVVTVARADVAAINSTLASVGYKGPPVQTGLYPNPLHASTFFGKVDSQLSARDQFSTRYSLYSVQSKNSRGAGGLNAFSAAAGLQDFDNTVAFSNIFTLSPTTVNETRGQFTYSSLEAPPNDPIGPAVSISGVASFGTLSASPTSRLNKQAEIADNIAHREGAHAFRAGVNFLYNDLAITFPQSIHGSYSFSSLTNLERGIYNNSGFTQSFGNPVVLQTNPNLGLYAQDEWKLSPSLTLNLGLRYDLQFLKKRELDTDNVSPRAGFAWSPFGSQKTILRGSFGLFYDRIPLRPLANALLSSGNTTDFTSATFVTVSLSPTQSQAPVFPHILTSLPAGVLVNYTTMDPHIQNAYAEQGSLQIERQVGAHSTVSVGYEHVRGLHLIASINRNAPTCLASGTNNGCRPNPNYGNNKQYSSAGDSEYHGFSLSFVQRPVRWGNYRLSYTYSKAFDDLGEFFFSSPIDNSNIWQDWGRSDDDQRHRVVLDGSLHTGMTLAKTLRQRLTNGFELSGALQYYSALPFNITTGANTIQGTTARPVVGGAYIRRNAGNGFDFFTVNTRLTRSFALTERLRMQAIAEAFNTLNHRNNLIPNGTFGPGLYPINPLPSFGQATAVGDPRTLQLAIRLTF
ncbi:MAG: TonB-dependent receptor [Acidobacteriaceae bacterium]|nr:TonB-dependent receptor [Acidobacteriaceae bacterium]